MKTVKVLAVVAALVPGVAAAETPQWRLCGDVTTWSQDDERSCPGAPIPAAGR